MNVECVIGGGAPKPRGPAQYLVRVTDLSPVVAMEFLVLQQSSLDRCKPGFGFSYGLNGRRVFCRRTKTGYSIVQLKQRVICLVGLQIAEPRLST